MTAFIPASILWCRDLKNKTSNRQKTKCQIQILLNLIHLCSSYLSTWFSWSWPTAAAPCYVWMQRLFISAGIITFFLCCFVRTSCCLIPKKRLFSVCPPAGSSSYVIRHQVRFVWHKLWHARLWTQIHIFNTCFQTDLQHNKHTHRWKWEKHITLDILVFKQEWISWL